MYFRIYFDRVTVQFKMDIDQIKMDIQNRMLDEKTDIFYKFLKRNVDCPNVDYGLKLFPINIHFSQRVYSLACYRSKTIDHLLIELPTFS